METIITKLGNKPKNIIAVTGTNGKTSVADIFRQIFVLNKRIKSNLPCTFSDLSQRLNPG